MKIKISIMLSALIIFTVSHSILFAGTTGKLAGKVIDKETGEPLPFVNITLEGTSLGGATDIEGYYVILNIPPGNYSIKVQYVGYQALIMENVPVSVDLTTTRDFELSSTAVELEVLIVTAERPLVIKDMTSSLSTITAGQIENLPVQNMQQVLRLSAGIIESDGRLHIRGGRAGEVAYWIDGVSATDVYDGRIGTTVENSAIQELQVISGTFNAEYGQAMSGVVNIITKEGGQNYTGQIKVYGGDYISSDDRFGLYNTLVTDADPVTGLTRIVSGDKEQPLERLNPIYNGELSLSGPVPLFGSSLTFFANGRYFYDEGYFFGRNWYRPNGTPGDGSLVAMNPNKTMSVQGKLTYQLSNAIRFSYNLFWTDTERERNYFRYNSPDYQFNVSGTANFQQFNVHDYKYNPYGLPKYFSEGFTHTFSLSQVLSSSTFYELRATRYFSKSKQYVYEDPFTSVTYLTQTDSAGRITYVPDPNDPDGYIDPESINPPISYSFLNKGMDVTNTSRSTAYWVGKIDFTSQLNETNLFKIGSEARLHELTLNSFQIVSRTDVNGQPLNPFQPAIPAVGSPFRHDYERKPREISAYIQDKIEFNDIILNVGLRYDYFDANSVIPTDPTDPNIYAPFKDEHIYKDIDQLIEYTPEERRAFMHTKVDAKTFFSPRLGIAFPITDRGVIHFSYGHFFQIPEFQYLYANPDFKVTSGSGSALFGNADLEPQKTVQYEIGLQQQLSDDIGVDLTLFYRDVRDWVGTSPIISTEYSPGKKTGVGYSKFENKDYENVKGITLKIEKRFTNNYSFRTDYTFQSAEGTYSGQADAYNASLANRSPVLSLLPMNWDQKHTFNAQFIYDISGWTFSLIGRYWSGRPYTPAFPSGESVGGSAISGLTTNSARRPAQKNIDLTISKMFQLFSNVRFEVFMNVYNLLDQRDETNVYNDTGTAEYTTNINPSIVPYNVNRVSTVEDYVLQPSWYTAPRQVHVGFILGF